MGSNAEILENSRYTKPIAKQRWRLLARAVTGDKTYDSEDRLISVRRFQCFGLFLTISSEEEETPEAHWSSYTSQDFPKLHLRVRHLQDNGSIKPEKLLGFNNTGNICIWPSEEVMTFHCLQNIDKFEGKSLIELGGGMTCLAGMAVSVCTEADTVVLTDGNEESLNNLTLMIDENKRTGKIKSKKISSRLVRWGPKVSEELIGSFDFVLCADCFFFDEGRSDLVDLVHSLLKPSGEAIMFAPRRGHTFNSFVELAKSKFSVSVNENYSEKIYGLHQKMLKKGKEHYDENIHYPLHVLLQKDSA